MRFFPHKPSILPPFMEPPIWHDMARKYICFVTPRGSVPLGILRGFCKLSGHRLKENVLEFPWIDVNRCVFLKAAFTSQNAKKAPKILNKHMVQSYNTVEVSMRKSTRSPARLEKRRSRHLNTDQASVMPSPNGVVLRTKQHQLGHSGFNLWWSLSSRMDTSVT